MADEPKKEELTDEQEQSLQDAITDLLEIPMFILSMIMLILLILELAYPLSPGARRNVVFAGSVIWWIFVAEYVLRVFLAENRLNYITQHWLDALFVFVPFLRVFRIARAARAFRFVRVVRPVILGKTYVTTRRGLRQLGSVLGKRSFPYVVATTTIVILIGALLMFLIERTAPGSTINTYGEALWWTIGVVTTVGNELYPVSAEGRIIATILMVYGVGIFGYVAATLASYFIGQDTGTATTSEGLTSDQERELQEISDKVNELLQAHRQERRRRE